MIIRQVGVWFVTVALAAWAIGSPAPAQYQGQQPPAANPPTTSQVPRQETAPSRGGSNFRGSSVGVGIDLNSLFGRRHGKGEVRRGPGGPLRLYRVVIPAAARTRQMVATDWMYAALDFQGRGLIGYFNLAIDGVWVVQNIPVASTRDGAPETRWFGFSPGGDIAHGVAPVSYGYSLTAGASEAPPPQIAQMVPEIEPVIVGGELCGPGPGGGRGLTGGALTGGTIATGEKAHTQSNFINQPAKLNECVPIAFSNSLEWLKKTKGLDVPDDKISPKGMDDTLHWKGKGLNYAKAVEDKVKAFGKVVDTSVDLTVDKLGKAIDDGCDIEMASDGHMAAIVGVTKLDNGKWSIDIAHDTAQGDDKAKHNTVTETVTFSPGDKKIKGGTFVDGQTVLAFVVECKKAK